MNYICGNHIKGEDGEKFFVDDYLEIYNDGSISGNGIIRQITSKGIYVDIGEKKDAYFRADQIDLIKSDSSKVDDPGIPLNEKYVLDTLDDLNIILKEKYMTKPDESGKTEERFKTISYHPSIEKAFASLVDREINMTCGKGLEEIVNVIEDLKDFKKRAFE
jgi:hypothetical protein